jgi:trehalose 6-phosphate phosphatase
MPSVLSPKFPAMNDRCALLLDIDGTLLDIALRPEMVVVPPGLAATLLRLRGWLGGALALISGRAALQIDQFFARDGFDLAGSHGHEWRTAGTGIVLAGAPSPLLGNTADAIAEMAGELPGLVIERKPHSLALHYRASPEQQADAWRLAHAALDRLGAGYRLQAGKAVVEIVPANAEKGVAIERFMQSPPTVAAVPSLSATMSPMKAAFRPSIDWAEFRSVSAHLPKHPPSTGCHHQPQ